MYGTVRALKEGGEEREDPGMEEGMVGDDLVQEGEVQRAVVAVQREVIRLRHDALHPSVKRAAGGLFLALDLFFLSQLSSRPAVSICYSDLATIIL
jgi:hypothetical protein